jgi:hypothetical protein
MLIPSNISSFYSNAIDKTALFQGDIIRADGVGLKESNRDCNPDYWMIITKNCDLVFIEANLPRRQNISIIPLFTINILQKLLNKDLLIALSRVRRKMVFMAIYKISRAFGNLKKSLIENLVQNKVSKFMFLPPDGKEFDEPMIIDFDIVIQLDGSDPQEVERVLKSKIIQLVSPFRERVAQRFAEHYFSIGIDDEEIRDREYVKKLKELLP